MRVLRAVANSLMMPLRRANRAVRMAPVPSTDWAPLRRRGEPMALRLHPIAQGACGAEARSRRHALSDGGDRVNEGLRLSASCGKRRGLIAPCPPGFCRYRTRAHRLRSSPGFEFPKRNSVDLGGRVLDSGLRSANRSASCPDDVRDRLRDLFGAREPRRVQWRSRPDRLDPHLVRIVPTTVHAERSIRAGGVGSRVFAVDDSSGARGRATWDQSGRRDEPEA
jgi:hypothetical protein